MKEPLFKAINSIQLDPWAMGTPKIADLICKSAQRQHTDRRYGSRSLHITPQHASDPPASGADEQWQPFTIPPHPSVLFWLLNLSPLPHFPSSVSMLGGFLSRRVYLPAAPIWRLPNSQKKKKGKNCLLRLCSLVHPPASANTTRECLEFLHHED